MRGWLSDDARRIQRPRKDCGSPWRKTGVRIPDPASVMCECCTMYFTPSAYLVSAISDGVLALPSSFKANELYTTDGG